MSSELPTHDQRNEAVLYAYLDLCSLINLNPESREGCVADWTEELDSLKRCAGKTRADMEKAFPWLPTPMRDLSPDTLKGWHKGRLQDSKF